MEDIIIRRLEPEDAETSWKWRNDPELWKFTDRAHWNHITKEIEQEWIKSALNSETVKRFAICIGKKQRYIGNIHLSICENKIGECHIFIGDKNQWGKGIAYKSTMLLIEYARQNFQLNKIRAKIHTDNMASRINLNKMGFKETGEIDGQYLFFELSLM